MKTSTAAKRANVMGWQFYAGKPFMSYAQHDRCTMMSLAERLAFFKSQHADAELILKKF